MGILNSKTQRQQCARARRARDARFDGRFFTAVKTTGIYCRPICPAKTPLEKNVEYYDSAHSASQSGYRPCLRCRPESAPHSPAWLGTQSSLNRALTLIQAGALQNQSLPDLSARLGMSDRHLRALFKRELGTSPKHYAIHQQCLFAKQLLHESSLKITDVALAAGFNSVRRFNEAMKQHIGLNPREIRQSTSSAKNTLSLKLAYRPPYAVSKVFSFLQARTIDGLEWGGSDCYGRTFCLDDTVGYFEIVPHVSDNAFVVTLQLNKIQHLYRLVQRLRRLFDLDARIQEIDRDLQSLFGQQIHYQPGLRVPGIWSTFEAGVRAVLGQQVSVGAARNLVTTMVDHLGQPVSFDNTPARYLFPAPEAVADSQLDFFRMPQARKDTLRRLADHVINSPEPDHIDAWLTIKGIGPWTANYVKLRASKDPDVWLAGDAGLKNALKNIERMPDIELAKPWRSYLTFQLWNQKYQ